MTGPFDVNLRHLRAVALIARRGSISAAAETAGLSQPALTQGLAKLEVQFGTALFERRADGMTTTAAGVTLTERVEAAFSFLAEGTQRSGRRFSRPDWLMTSTQLRAMIALADAGSFVAAAIATGLSQPAIHRAVRDLEQVVGTALVERRGRGVALTAPARRLVRGMRLATNEFAAALAELRPTWDEGSGIAIGAMPLSRARLLPTAIARLGTEQPGIRFSVIEGSWRELVEPLREGVLDLIIGAIRPVALPDLNQMALCENRLVIVAGARHPLAGSTDVSRDVLASYPWIVAHPESPLRGQWEDFFATGSRQPDQRIECGSVMTIRGLLTSGDFLTLLSPEQVELEVKAGVLAHVGVPLGSTVRIIGATTRVGWRPTTVQRRFLELLRGAAGSAAIQESE